MFAALVLSLILTLVCLATWREFHLRWSNHHKFINGGSAQVVNWTWPGASRGQFRRVVLESTLGGDFKAQVGFRLGPTLVDFYGFVESEDGQVVLETWVRSPKEFIFLVEAGVEVTAHSSESDQTLKPRYTFPPHWWQRLGFFA